MAESLKTPLATCLLRLLTAGFERSRGTLTAFGSNISLLTHKSELCGGAQPSSRITNLLVWVHAGEAAGMASLTALRGNVFNLFLGSNYCK